MRAVTLRFFAVALEYLAATAKKQRGSNPQLSRAAVLSTESRMARLAVLECLSLAA